MKNEADRTASLFHILRYHFALDKRNRNNFYRIGPSRATEKCRWNSL